jgi:ACS family glucarate transporter-like MFS transporter
MTQIALEGPRTDQRLGRHSWILLLMMLAVALGHFNRISITVAGAERLIPTYGLKPTQMGWIYTAYLLVYTLCMTPGGWFIDRFGARRALLIVLTSSAVFMYLVGLSMGCYSTAFALWANLLVLRSLMGLFNAPQHPSAARLVGDLVPPSARNLLNGSVNFAACVGISSTYLLFGWLIDRFDWDGASLCASGVTFVLVLIWLLFVDRREGSVRQSIEPPHRSAGEFAFLFHHPSMFFLTLSYALVGYFQYLFFYWAQYYFEQVRHLPAGTSRLYTTLLTLAMGLGMVVGGLLGDVLQTRWRHRWACAIIPVAGLVFSAGLVLPGIFSSDPEVTLVCFILAMAGVGAGEGTFWTLAVELGGERGGTAAGILNTGGNAGGLLAPVITPYLSQLLGWQTGLGVASVVCLLGALCWWWIEPAPQKLRQDP